MVAISLSSMQQNDTSRYKIMLNRYSYIYTIDSSYIMFSVDFTVACTIVFLLNSSQNKQIQDYERCS